MLEIVRPNNRWRGRIAETKRGPSCSLLECDRVHNRHFRDWVIRVVAFYGSTLALIVSIGLVMAYGRRRPVGTPVTWGEAMVGAIILFWLMFLAYGIVPDAFVKWADGQSLNWRNDARGIPAGPLQSIMNEKWENHWYSQSRNVFFPDGITFFGRGRVIVTKETVRDIIAANIYIVFLGAHIYLWTAWQKRGKKAAELAALEPKSSYGRPLVKKA